MAKLSKDDVLKLAQLSRLHLTEDEVKRFQKEIEAILGYVEQLQGLDLNDYKPTVQVTGLKNVMRRDEIRDYGANSEQLLRNAPAKENGHFKVKRMLQ